MSTNPRQEVDGSPASGADRAEQPAPCRRPLLSVVTSALNEERNLKALHGRLVEALQSVDVDWEWVIVDDHSTDGTLAVIAELASADARVRGIRLSRNSGSHTGIACGLSHAAGDCAVVIAADLQDPPECIPSLLDKWKSGGQVVWAARRSRTGESPCTLWFARRYYNVMRGVVGITGMPETGADFFLLDRRVIDVFCTIDEANVSVMALIAWMGFRQEQIEYDKRARLAGTSGWSVGKKVKLAVDSVIGFSYLPIRLMSFLGVVFAFLGLVWAVVVVAGRFMGYVVAGTGYAALMTVLLLGFGFLMTFLGVLGEYLWRTLDQVRGRPRFIVEDTVNPAAAWRRRSSDQTRKQAEQSAHRGSSRP